MNPSPRILKLLSIIITFLISALLMVSIPAGAVQYSISRITNNYYPDYLASYDNPTNLNNAGQLVWIEADTPNGTIIFYRDSTGNIQQIASYNYPAPNGSLGYVSINNKGQIAWSVYNGSTIQLYLKDPHNTAQLITQFNTEKSTEFIFKLNNIGQLVWQEGDLSYNKAIKLYDSDSIVTIGTGQFPDINNKGQIVYVDSNQKINIYNNRVISQIPSDANNYLPKINDLEQIVWFGVNTPSQSWELFLYDFKNRNGPKQVSNGINVGNLSFWGINNYGQIVWSAGTDNTFSYYEVYLYDSASNTTQTISQGHSSPSRPEINDCGQVIWSSPSSSGGYDLYLSSPGSRNNAQRIDKLTSNWGYCINNTGRIAYMGNLGTGYWSETEIYLATPQVVNVPIPTATPPLSTFPQPNKLFVDSGTFIKNNSASFSPDSQQLFKDNQTALDRFLSKFITSEDGFKATANLGKNAFSWLGTGLGALSVHDTTSFLLFAGKQAWNPILDQNNDWQTRWLIDGLTAGGSLLTSPIIYAPLTLGGLFCTGYVFMFDLIAEDPPDPNFTEVYQCPVANFSPFNLPGVSQEMNRLVGLQFGSSYNTYYCLLGLTTSINRYSSALAAGDAVSAGLQFEAFVKYLALYDASAIQTANYINQLKQGWIIHGMPDFSYNREEMLDLQNQIRENGLLPEVITSFKNLGLTDSQIATIKQAVLDYVPPDSVPGSLYSNLSNGVNQLHNVSSWRPPNPAIYLLLMD